MGSELVPETQQQVDVLLVNTSSSWTTSDADGQHDSSVWTTSSHHKQHIYVTIKPSAVYGMLSFHVAYMAGWWRWALVSPDGMVPSRMVGVSASVNPSLHHKVQKFSSGTSSPRVVLEKGP